MGSGLIGKSASVSTSSLSINTWPEAGYVAVDTYTCGGLDPRPAFEYLYRSLEPENCRTQEIIRGLEKDGAEEVDLLAEDVQVISRVAPLEEFSPALQNPIATLPLSSSYSEESRTTTNKPS